MMAGHALVRRFTDEQGGKTTLERATKVAQEEQDSKREKEEKDRLSAYFTNSNSGRNEVYFHQAEVAEQALKKTCEEFFKKEKSSGLAKFFGIRRKQSRSAANEVMQQYVAANVEELQAVVDGLDTRWREKQSKAFGHLRRLCSTLHAHKKAFAILPSQNNYASSLCGGLTFLISAAVNYDEIAEVLSESITMVAVKVSSIAEIVDMIETRKMCELYAELHAHVFLFYRDAIAWYMERKRDRLFKSFNEQLKRGYERAIERIKDCITALLLQTEVAKMAMTKTLLLGVEGLQREVFRQRQQLQVQSDIARAGVQMQNLLHAMVYSKVVELANAGPGENQSTPAQGPQPLTMKMVSVDRAKALDQAARLKTFVIGDEGQSLFEDGRFWVPQADASAKLVKWMDQDNNQSRLWINSPLAARGMPSSRAAAMAAVVAAWQSEESIISHFCARPNISSPAKNRHPEQAGLIGLVYSLIVQLLQFQVENDAFEVTEDQVAALDGSDDSWVVALRTLSDLLQATPQLSICVIDDLNVLALSAGVEWCTRFLDVLFEHQQACAHTFRVLLTTAGYSNAIPQYFERDNCVFVQRGAQEVLRRELQALEPGTCGELRRQHI